MTLGDILRAAGIRLSGPAADGEAEALLRHVTGISRAALYCHLDQVIDAKAAEEYLRLVERLKNGEPLQYLTGHIEFFGLDFCVSPSVLIPRPATELMVERAIDIATGYSSSPVIADIGCGSGAVAVALAKHLPGSSIFALDISDEALELAGKNAVRHGCGNISFHKSDLLEMVSASHFDIICANLPYVPAAECQSNHFEPQLALDGGIDGLDIIRRLVRQISEKNDKPDWLLLEFGTSQDTAVKAIIEACLPRSHTEIFYDLIPVERVSVTRL